MVLGASRGSPVRLGFFVEGLSDKRVIGALARKVLSKSTALDFRELDNGVRSFDAIKRHAQALLKLHQDVSKVIVCADMHSDQVKKREIQNTENSLRRATLPIPVRYVKVLHAIEGWLLADPNALKQTLGPDASLGNIPSDLESYCDQVRILEEIFGRNGRHYKKVRWAPAIAEHVDVNLIKTRMSSFRAFLDALTDP